MAILERNSISKESIGTTLTAVAKSVKKTLFAHSSDSITGLRIGGIDVAIALARFAKVPLKTMKAFSFGKKETRS